MENETEPSKIQEAAKIPETDRKMDSDDHASEPTKPDDSEGKSNVASVSSAFETDASSKAQEVEQIKETDQKIDPVHEDAPEPIEPNATRVLALDMIVKSLSQIRVFMTELANFQEKQQIVTQDETVVQPLQRLYEFLVNKLSLTDPMMGENSACDMSVTIMELLRNYGSLNSHFELYEYTKKNCNRCKMNSGNLVERSYGLLMHADSIRVINEAFKDFRFENILKTLRMNLKMPCYKEGCGKLNYVQRTIYKLPSVFTIALQWENNETDAEILHTTSLLTTEIDISSIYLYEGQCPYTKYSLVSMVCLDGDEYNCVGYENNSWVRHCPSEKEVIGVWDSVVKKIETLQIRPVILFFEYVNGKEPDCAQAKI